MLIVGTKEKEDYEVYIYYDCDFDSIDDTKIKFSESLVYSIIVPTLFSET